MLDANIVSKICSGGFELNLSVFELYMSTMKVKDAYADVLCIILNDLDLRLEE